MSKILVIVTGGTIGSCVQEKVISAKAERSAQIVALYESKYGKRDTFEVVQPLNQLSENLHPGKWEAIKDVLDAALEKDYDGVIITHGSDTLAYTSAFMGMLYSWADVPIAVTAANYPLDDPRSNGMHNFAGAVSFIREKAVTGVFAIYENMNSEVEVFLPTRLLNSDPYFDQYRSFDRQVFGWIKDETFTWNPDCSVTVDMVKNREKSKHFDFQYKNEVLFIPVYLGINFRNFVCGEKVKAVVLSLYHSATAPSTENAGLLEFIENCNQAGIEVYGTSFKNPDMSCYQSTHVLLQKGLKPLYNISGISSYVKMVLAYNQTIFNKESLIEKSIYFESLEIV